MKGPDRHLQCPNGDGPLHEIVTTGRYGAELVLDQCGNCGGIWFDQYELFRVDEAQARQVEGVNEQTFRTPGGTAKNPQCPVCHVPLEFFHDVNIPDNVQLLSCPRCNGFWANHGQLTGYAEFRASRGHKRPDPELAEAYERMLRSESRKDYYKGIEDFGRSVGGQRDFLTGLPLDGTPSQLARIDEAQDIFYTMLGVAARLLFWWF